MQGNRLSAQRSFPEFYRFAPRLYFARAHVINLLLTTLSYLADEKVYRGQVITGDAKIRPTEKGPEWILFDLFYASDQIASGHFE